MRLILSLSALAATLVTATPAFAATVRAKVTAEVVGVVLQPLTLTKVDSLDFGTVVGSALPGVVTIDPDKSLGARSITGGVIGVPSFPGHRGLFQGAGTAGNAVQLTLSAPAVLTSTNLVDTLAVTSMSLDSGGANRTIDSTSAFTVGVGGVFAIAASQPNGVYSATFDLTADYL
jgi:hypothetical protein